MVAATKGERTVEALGKKWTIVFDINAICALEEDRGKSFFEAMQDMMPAIADIDVEDEAALAEASKRMRFTDLRALFGHALDAHHPGLTNREVGEIMQDIGLGRALPLLMATVAACMTEGDDEAPGNPRRKGGKRATG